MALLSNEIYQGDCIAKLAQIEPGTIDLAFADPPFNIGYEYDVYKDRRNEQEYLDWTRKWMTGVSLALKPSGTFWLAIGDEYAAELKLIACKEAGFACRSWVIWYYTFGVNCTRAFSRSHTHLFHFLKDSKIFTFNADDPAVRVPSARQLVYADGRANPKGRLPDNTWILRPQDVPNGFRPDHDTWYYPRVAGTFKEREGFHGCQMPEQLLGRIIRCCSNPMEIVLDPFGGSGTTFAVAKKLGRQWIGFELSKEYVARIKARLKKTSVGDALDGAADPLSSAPATIQQGRAPRKASRNGCGARHVPRNSCRPARRDDDDVKSGVIEAYCGTHAGASVDHLLADPCLNAAFLEACAKISMPGNAIDWNRTLLRIRKAGELPLLQKRVRALTFAEMDAYSFASEIALQQLSAEHHTTLDGILCDPQLAARFDELAGAFAPGYTPFQYRWAALAIRKRAKYAKKLARDHFEEWSSVRLPRSKPILARDWNKFACQGVYILTSESQQQLYIGETFDLRQRVQPIAQLPSWKRFRPSLVKLIPADRPCGLQSYLIHKFNPVMNSQLLVPEIPAKA